MTFQSFVSVCALFTIFVSIIVQVAETQTVSYSSSSSSSSSSSATTYGSEINGGEIGIKMKYDSSVDTKMNVIISYDTETTAATDFFQKQFTADLFKQFSDCDVINWNFMPCGTSRLNGGTLYCPQGEDQCKYDKIHACVANLYKNDEEKIGQFIICFFNNDKNVDKCVSDNKLAQNDIDRCVNDQGAIKCDEFYNIIHGPGSKQFVGSSTSTGISSSDGTTNFKGVLCGKLASVKLQCGYCSS